LKNIFEEIRKVNADASSVDLIMISNTTIGSINPEDFAGINVRYGVNTELEISLNLKLSYIDPNAFNGFNPFIFNMYSNPVLNESALQVLKDLKNASQYNIYGNDIKSIPEGSFSELKSVYTIFLSNNKINHISTRAFEMVHEIGWDTIDHEIFLDSNQLQSNSFEMGAFDGLNQTTNGKPICWEINLMGNNITYLSESIFAPYLDTVCGDPDDGNRLYLRNNPFICDCRMKWLMDGRERYVNLVLYLSCSNNNNADFWSYKPEDFENCELQSSTVTQTSVDTTTKPNSGSYPKFFLTNIYTLICLFFLSNLRRTIINVN